MGLSGRAMLNAIVAEANPIVTWLAKAYTASRISTEAWTGGTASSAFWQNSCCQLDSLEQTFARFKSTDRGLFWPFLTFINY